MRRLWILFSLVALLAACAPEFQIAKPTISIPRAQLAASPRSPASGKRLTLCRRFRTIPRGRPPSSGEPEGLPALVRPGGAAQRHRLRRGGGRAERIAAVRYPWGGGGGLATLVAGAEGWKNYRVEAVFKTEDDQWWVFGNLNGNGSRSMARPPGWRGRSTATAPWSPDGRSRDRRTTEAGTGWSPSAARTASGW